MKKFFMSIALLLFTAIFFSTTASAAEKGSRENPFSAYDQTSFTLQNYSFDTPKKIKLQLVSLTSGPTVDALMQSENMFNTVPTANQQWSLFEFKITHVSNPKDEALELYNVIQYFSDDFYFDANFRSISNLDIATFGDKYEHQSLDSQSIYPGSSTTAYTAHIFNKSTPYPYFRIQRANGQYYWFSTNPSYKPKNTVDLNKAGITTKVDDKSLTYTGKAFKPKVSVYDKKKKQLKNNVDYTVTYSNNTKVGYGTYTVKGKGNYYGSKKYSFKIKPKKTTVTSIKNSKAKQVDLKWKKVTGAKYYKVAYKTGSTTKSLTVKGTSASIKKLSKNKTYKFNVTAYYTSKVYSSQSSTKSLKIKK